MMDHEDADTRYQRRLHARAVAEMGDKFLHRLRAGCHTCWFIQQTSPPTYIWCGLEQCDPHHDHGAYTPGTTDADMPIVARCAARSPESLAYAKEHKEDILRNNL